MGTALAIALLIISSIVIHGIFHYALAIVFGYKPKLYFSSYLIPTVLNCQIKLEKNYMLICNVLHEYF